MLGANLGLLLYGEVSVMVSRKAELMCARRGCTLLAESCPSHVSVYQNVWGLATLTKLNAEVRIYRTNWYIYVYI